MKSPGPNYVRLFVDEVFMGWFSAVPDRVYQIGLEYSLVRIWDGKLILDRIEDKDYYYSKPKVTNAQ